MINFNIQNLNLKTSSKYIYIFLNIYPTAHIFTNAYIHSKSIYIFNCVYVYIYICIYIYIYI